VEIAVVAVAYLSGSIPWALLLVRLSTGRDVRRTGSGNVGATNAARAAGWWVGALVAILDVGKGAAPVLLMQAVDPSSAWIGAAAVAAVLGHCFPVWLSFRGGKGVATGAGAFLPLAPLAVLGAAAVWIVAALIWRYASVASMTASVLFPVILSLLGRPSRWIVLAAAVVAVIIVLRHLSNLRRLAAGNEPRLDELPGRNRKGDRP